MAYYDPYYDTSLDPEAIGPPPPSFGEMGGDILLPDEKVSRPKYLPNNPDGSISSAPIGPEPPKNYFATNVPDTARKWGAQGQDYTFLAESPGAVKTAKELGAPRVMKGYDPVLDQAKPAAIGPEPKPEELDEFTKAEGFWKHIVDTEHGGVDPVKINPAEVGMLKRQELQKKYDLELFNRGAGSKEYREIQKHIDQQVKEVEAVAERQRSGAAEKRKEVLTFAKSKLAEERKANQPKPAGVLQSAQQYTERALFGPNSWQNKILTPEEQILADAKTPPPIPKNRRFQPRILEDVNRVRTAAGLPPIVEKQDPDKRMREVTTFLGFELGKPTFTTEPRPAGDTGGYNYEAGQAQAQRIPNNQVDRSRWKRRQDGTEKGYGWLGVLPMKNGQVATEATIGVNLNGKEMEIPTLVPTLSPEEVNYILGNDLSPEIFKTTIGKGIVQKAVAHARQRIQAGQSPFAEGGGGVPSGGTQVVRTGTHNGRRVVQYADGRTEYAPN